MNTTTQNLADALRQSLALLTADSFPVVEGDRIMEAARAALAAYDAAALDSQT